MNIIDNILRQLYQIVTCPRCNRKYTNGEIKLCGYLGNIVILEAICANQHKPIYTLLLIDCQTKHSFSHKNRRVLPKDVYRLKIFLNDFNGDFHALFNGSKNEKN